MEGSNDMVNALDAGKVAELKPPEPIPNDLRWGWPKSIGHLIEQLQALNAPERPVRSLYFFDLDGERVVRAKGLSMSWERIDGNELSKDQTVPFSLAFWVSEDERAFGKNGPRVAEAARERTLAKADAILALLEDPRS